MRKYNIPALHRRRGRHTQCVKKRSIGIDNTNVMKLIGIIEGKTKAEEAET